LIIRKHVDFVKLKNESRASQTYSLIT
jgi:hypothetical protein